MLTHISTIYPGQSCPRTHPFAFNDGKFCCKHHEDVEGNTISYSSDSCKHDASGINQSATCPKPPCTNNYGMC